MQTFFGVAISFLIMMLFVNGTFFVFGGDLAGTDFSYASQNDLLITQEEIKDSATASENTVKEGDAFAAIFSFVSMLVGTVTGTIGTIGRLVGLLLAFGNAWAVILEIIFGSTGSLWTFLQLTLIPFINLLQLGSITYLILYAVSAVRGGSV